MSSPISLGIDLGTSELKAVMLSEDGSVVGQAGVRLPISRPIPGWSEQDPEDWWTACVGALGQLRNQHPDTYARIRCIGLSGQMHGAVLLDKNNRCIRPAILWNDSRATSESAALARRHPSFSEVTGSLPMAGLTAPKLLWLNANEPKAFAAVDCVISPKDYLRLRLSGDRATDMSDAAGTLWLDVRRRSWFAPIVAATGLSLEQLPALVEGVSATGSLIPSVATILGLDAGCIVAGGAGDNPASAVGIGAVSAGDSFVTLGTSAAVVSVTDVVAGNAAGGVHSYCHALPDRWYAMGAILSGASCLRWVAGLVSQLDEKALIDRVAAEWPVDRPMSADAPIFLPYLSGERTPHNDPLVRGGFMNLGHDTSAASLGYAVLEGVGFALRDAVRAIESAGAVVSTAALVGGGARSEYWAQLLSDVLGIELHTLAGSELSASIGAAKLGFIAYGRGDDLLKKGLPVKASFHPNASREDVLGQRYEKFVHLFPAAKSLAAGNSRTV
ncbi:xylulokinase [Burkholderia sp. GAS332]|nr:xylulokinase [Burkholderia sp. GAS332]